LELGKLFEKKIWRVEFEKSEEFHESSWMMKRKHSLFFLLGNFSHCQKFLFTNILRKENFIRNRLFVILSRLLILFLQKNWSLKNETTYCKGKLDLRNNLLRILSFDFPSWGQKIDSLQNLFPNFPQSRLKMLQNTATKAWRSSSGWTVLKLSPFQVLKEIFLKFCPKSNQDSHSLNSTFKCQVVSQKFHLHSLIPLWYKSFNF